MSILGIQNRTENWKTARCFAPLFRHCDLRLKLAQKLGEPDRTQPDEVHLELYWKGMRDHLHQTGKKMKDCEHNFAKRYRHLFPDLRKRIQDFGKFQDLQCLNYNVCTEEGAVKLGNNLFNTEIDIVLQTPNHLFIGEAKQEMGFNASGSLVLVHQLIRQYVTAKVLVDTLRCDRIVTPFVVWDKPKGRRPYQVDFMVKQGWLKEDNLLTWNDIENLTHDS